MLAGAFLSTAFVIVRFVMLMATDWKEIEAGLPADPNQHAAFYAGVYGALIGPIVVCLVVMVGSVLMMARKSYVGAIIGSIAAVLPCNWCCFVTIPFGIWALVSLAQPDVKSAFH
jgi:hypothetical protein